MTVAPPTRLKDIGSPAGWRADAVDIGSRLPIAKLAMRGALLELRGVGLSDDAIAIVMAASVMGASGGLPALGALFTAVTTPTHTTAYLEHRLLPTVMGLLAELDGPDPIAA